ncbi:unnamed protein product, partial [Phaeothamnion confervicola]
MTRKRWGRKGSASLWVWESLKLIQLMFFFCFDCCFAARGLDSGRNALPSSSSNPRRSDRNEAPLGQRIDRSFRAALFVWWRHCLQDTLQKIDSLRYQLTQLFEDDKNI